MWALLAAFLGSAQHVTQQSKFIFVCCETDMSWAGVDGLPAIPYEEWLEMWRGGSDDWARGAVLCSAMPAVERLWLPNACGHCLVRVL